MLAKQRNQWRQMRLAEGILRSFRPELADELASGPEWLLMVLMGEELDKILQEVERG